MEELETELGELRAAVNAAVARLPGLACNAAGGVNDQERLAKDSAL
jgi:hypothetical protein